MMNLPLAKVEEFLDFCPPMTHCETGFKDSRRCSGFLWDLSVLTSFYNHVRPGCSCFLF